MKCDLDHRVRTTLEFLNPADGGPVMATISAHVRLLHAGFATRTRRSTDATIFVVVEGTGRAFLGEDVIELSPRDVVVIPSWTPLRFEATETLVLFGYSDRACQEKLNLYREDNA